MNIEFVRIDGQPADAQDVQLTADALGDVEILSQAQYTSRIWEAVTLSTSETAEAIAFAGEIELNGYIVRERS